MNAIEISKSNRRELKALAFLFELAESPSSKRKIMLHVCDALEAQMRIDDEAYGDEAYVEEAMPLKACG